MNIYIIFIGIAIASYLVQQSLTSKFRRYSRVRINSYMTGRDVALKMLHDNGIYDVKVTSVSGTLTDHYNPATKTVNLSDGVFATNSVTAAAVAAHECGHAIQHACGYAPLRLRSALVPIVSFASQWMSWVLLAGILLVQSFPLLLELGIALFAMTTLFSLVTLPVEVDASRRAVRWLSSAGITDHSTTPVASSLLHSAAYTYVVSALGSLATLCYYVMVLLGNRRD